MKSAKLPRWVLALIPIAVILIAWQVLAQIGIISSALFSSPIEIVEELVDLHQKDLPVRSVLLIHIATTLRRVLVSAAAGISAGVVIGVVMGIFRGVQRLLDPLITLLMPIPGIAMAPLFIVWLGFGDPTILTLGVIATLFPVIYNTTAGVRSIDKQLIRAAQVAGASPFKVLTNVYLPWSAGYVLTGVKLGLARCWRTIIAVELVASANWGLGYMIWNAAEYLRAGVVYGGIGLLIVVYFVMEKGLVSWIENRTLRRWGIIQE